MLPDRHITEERLSATMYTIHIRKLCSAPLNEAQLHCPQLVDECEALRDKFEPLFTLFGLFMIKV